MPDRKRKGDAQAATTTSKESNRRTIGVQHFISVPDRADEPHEFKAQSQAPTKSLEERIAELEGLVGKDAKEPADQIHPLNKRATADRAPRAPGMTDLTDQLHGSIECLASRLKTLESSLEPVLLQVPEDRDGAMAGSIGSPMPQALHSVFCAAQRVDHLSQLIDSIVERLRL